MEVVGFIAALPTLIKTVTVICQAGVSLCRAIHDGPEDLGRVVLQLIVIRSELELLQDIRTESAVERYNSNPEAVQLFQHAFDNAENSIKAIHEACQKRTQRSGHFRSLRWALIDSNTVKRLMIDLHHAESSLNLVIQLLSMYERLTTSCDIGN
jgi:hypothetical protein